MYRTLLKSKIHRATVTDANLNYEGSISIDVDLMKEADLVEFEKVDIYNINNGKRLSTYVIPGEKREICLNGAAARLNQVGDKVIIASYILSKEIDFSPKIILVDDENKKSEKKSVVLFSGGLDSTTCLVKALNEGFTPHALTINYGQRHSFEIEAAKNIIQSYNIQNHSIINIDLSQFGGSALTDNIDVPKNRNIGDNNDIPITYVPARNTVFLSLALAWAETLNAYDLFIGVNALDYSGYPDCRPEYINSFEKTANLATRAGVLGEKFTIHTPLINMTKAQIIREGLELGVDYSLTSSCYDPKKMVTRVLCAMHVSCDRKAS